MSRQHEFDHAALDHLVESYHDERGDPAWITEPVYGPHHAAGRCHLASEDFVAWARTRGHAAHLVERSDTPGFRGEHVAAVVHDRFVVDPTSAQLPHTHGMPYETVDYDPEVHRKTTGWYGDPIPEGPPAKLGKPRWPANKSPDDLTQAQAARVAGRATWVRWK